MKTKRSKEDIALLKIHAAIKTVKRANRLGVLNAARNLALVTGIAKANIRNLPRNRVGSIEPVRRSITFAGVEDEMIFMHRDGKHWLTLYTPGPSDAAAFAAWLASRDAISILQARAAEERAEARIMNGAETMHSYAANRLESVLLSLGVRVAPPNTVHQPTPAE